MNPVPNGLDSAVEKSFGSLSKPCREEAEKMWNSVKSMFENDSVRTAADRKQVDANYMESAVISSSVAIMMVDRDFVVRFVNEETRKLLKENEEVFRGLWPTFDADRIVGSCIDMFHKNPAHQRALLSDPSRLPYRTEISVGDKRFALNVGGVFDAQKNYLGNVLEWADIGDARLNEGKLKALQVSQAIIEFTTEGEIITANSNFLDVVGYSLQEVKGKHHSMFVDPAYANSPEYRAFWERLNRGETVAEKFRRFGKNGKEIWLQASYNPIIDRNGKLLSVVKFATDVTEIEKEANERTAKLAAISRSQAVIEFDLDGTVLSANENFLKVLDYSVNDIVGRHHSMFVDPDYAKSADYRAFWERLGKGEFIADKFRRLGRGGKEVWIQASYNPLLDLNGKPFKVIKFASDVTDVENERKAAEEHRAEKAAEQAQVVGSLAKGLTELSAGNLTAQLEDEFAAEYEQLRHDFNATASRLRETMQSVMSATRGISTGADEVSQAADDLSKRTEQQAASLEETAAALEEITATVRKTAQNAKDASAIVTTAKSAAEDGGQIVDTAITAMGQIEQSSKQITDIISVIDEIAFQTNLLALNAGVEAARAGDAGRGFAVVASEVRALAQRSSEAAREIKTLIKASSEHVESGVKLVGESGQALRKIVDQVVDINSLVSEMAMAAQQQSTGIEEVNTAVAQMDQVTQQNAAMVEQSTAASRNLASETTELSELVSFFRVGEAETSSSRVVPAAARSGGSNTKPRVVAKNPPRVASGSGRMAAVAVARHEEEDDWQEF